MILGSFLLLSSMVMLGQNTYKNPVKATNLPDPRLFMDKMDGFMYMLRKMGRRAFLFISPRTW